MMIGMVTQIQFIGILEIMKGSGGHLEKKKLKKYKYDGEIDGSRNRAISCAVMLLNVMIILLEVRIGWIWIACAIGIADAMELGGIV